LPLQSSNGGFPAWEPQRAHEWLEVTSQSLISLFILMTKIVIFTQLSLT